MILLLLAQLAVTGDSVYSSAALRTLVSRAAVENHAPPPSLRGYRAHVESEMSLILRDTLGREGAGQVEQLASTVDWTRGNAYDMHIVGYRTQGLGSPVSALSFIRGWTEPSLFGERMRLGVGFGGATRTEPAPRPSPSRDSVVAVHPFASDRDTYYTFSGGDTVTVLRAGDRSITVVRVRVKPHLTGETRLSAFDGEIDLDVGRQQIVRMRGRFVVLARTEPDLPLVARMAGVTGVAYVEFVNTEVNGRYWLPAFQRTEFQSSMAVLGQGRAVMRILSTFSEYEVSEAAAPGTVDDTRRIARRTTWARADTVNAFSDWRASVGDATTRVTANDFDDVAPDAWRKTGGMRIELIPTNIDNVVRFDRVEGLFTGYQATVQMRSVAPGLSFGAHGGWAWSEKTLRGGANVALQRNHWILGARGERALRTTNDFIRPFDPESGGLAAMLGGVDDFDYVDRRVALASATRIIGSVENAIVTAQGGLGDDRDERARLNRGWLGAGTFRPNRGVLPGRYAIAMIDAELHPGMSGDFVQPGFGARVHYEIGRGALEWQRTELSVSSIRYWGPVAVRLQGDAGAVSGATIPPQKLFEMGGSGVLPGYAYKEFAGDRAALFRGFGSYSLPLWRTPHRFGSGLFLPGVSPAIAASLQGGWTEFSNNAARTASLAFGSFPPSRATDGVRATLGLGMTFFSNVLHAGFARPVDRAAPWKFTIGGGPSF